MAVMNLSGFKLLCLIGKARVWDVSEQWRSLNLRGFKLLLTNQDYPIISWMRNCRVLRSEELSKATRESALVGMAGNSRVN